MSDAICAGADPVSLPSQVLPQNAASTETDGQRLEDTQTVPPSQETCSDPSEDSTSLSEAGHVEDMCGSDSGEDAEGVTSLSEGHTEIHNYIHKHYHVHNDTFMFRTEKHDHQHHEHHYHFHCHWHLDSKSRQPEANTGHPQMLPGVGPQPQPPKTSPESQDQDAQACSQALVSSDSQHEGRGPTESQLSRPTKLRRMNASSLLEEAE